MNYSMRNTAAAFAKSAMILLAVLFLSGRSYSQISVDDITGTAKVNLKPNAIENLKLQITSENTGVRKCAIYFAGYYKVSEALMPLMKQMEKEKEPSVRILIALSLYKLNSQDALDLVSIKSVNDPDINVRKMCAAICSDHSINNGSVATK
ncbi:MAG: HEAT repeat domain-containing protein [Syntrophothermus sp.]